MIDSDFIIKKLNIPRKEADFLREEYYHSFGTTMHGLMHHHNVDPYEFLRVIDDVPLERLQVDIKLLRELSNLRKKGKCKAKERRRRPFSSFVHTLD